MPRDGRPFKAEVSWQDTTRQHHDSVGRTSFWRRRQETSYARGLETNCETSFETREEIVETFRLDNVYEVKYENDF